jgi:hypothetical protein
METVQTSLDTARDSGFPAPRETRIAMLECDPGRSNSSCETVALTKLTGPWLSTQVALDRCTPVHPL